jgi:hypothetical protein
MAEGGSRRQSQRDRRAATLERQGERRLEPDRTTGGGNIDVSGGGGGRMDVYVPPGTETIARSRSRCSSGMR